MQAFGGGISGENRNTGYGFPKARMVPRHKEITVPYSIRGEVWKAVVGPKRDCLGFMRIHLSFLDKCNVNVYI